jgi:transglutaminase-like putative cysteine protease
MPVFRIHHVTKYTYSRPVKENSNEIRIYPFECAEQEILLHEINITNNPDTYTYTDYWGNRTGNFSLLNAHKELVIESKLVVRTITADPLHISSADTGFDALQKEIKQDVQLTELIYAEPIKLQHKIDEIVTAIMQPGKAVAHVVEACCAYIFKHFRYIKGITNIETTVDEILEMRSGVCQDFAHLMLQVLRTLQIPARYVSGYICPNKNGMRGEGATHAWVEAWIPGYGWAGIDPTNNIWVTNNHVKLAVGRHFKDCTPIKGAFKGPAKQALSVYVSVGYEDGQVFEELNNVKMEALSTDDINALIVDDGSAGQQQQ